MGWRRVLTLAGLLLALLPAAAGPARADGAFFKERRFPVPPTIPSQRALVIHRDGIESLVVESSLDAEGQSFGWILPLPARPTTVEAVPPGVLDTLDLATRPRVESGDRFSSLLVPAGLLLLLVLVLRIHYTRLESSRLRSGLDAFVLIGLLVVLAAVLVPNLLAARLGAGSVEVAGVRATDAQRIGHYEVVVLEARDAAALGNWLDANGLAPLPAAGVPIVADSIARGWVFVAARLTATEAGPAAPHPLSVVFPSAKPVYPMRLTALAGGTTALRIHVAAAGTASCPPLEAGFSGPFEKREERVLRMYDDRPERPMLVNGGILEPRRLAHPFLVERLWDGCVVTRLEGSMAAAAMDRDLEFAVGEVRPSVRTLYTTTAGWLEGFETVGPWWALALLVLGCFPDRLLPVPLGRARPLLPFLQWVVLLTVLAAAAAGLVQSRLEKIPVEGLVSSGRPDPFRYDGAGFRILCETDGFAGLPLPEVRALLEQRFRARAVHNPFTGRPVRWGDSPGDVELVEDERGPVLRVRSLGGAPVDMAWQEMRLLWFLYYGARPPLPQAFGTAEARERLFPGDVLAGGIRNPFTGEPVKHGAGPGDAMIVETEKGIFLRAWVREGRYRDFRLP